VLTPFGPRRADLPPLSLVQTRTLETYAQNIELSCTPGNKETSACREAHSDYEDYRRESGLDQEPILATDLGDKSDPDAETRRGI
jgi:hypothetical protein